MSVTPDLRKGGSPTSSPYHTTTAIDTKDLAKRYGKISALAGITMSVPRGEVFGFLGPNGAGKTTAVKLLLGLVHPTSGQGTVLDAPLGNIEARRKIGYLPELFRYQDWLTAREVLMLHCELAGVPTASRVSEIDAALDIVGLVRRSDDRVGTFSKGMQQRLGLGVALLGEPELVFLDEPTSALDPIGRYDVREVIRGLKQRGTTVFLNSHLLSEVEQVCDRVAVMDRGKVIAIGSMADILGKASAVRIRVTGLTTSAEMALGRFGIPETEGAWYTFRGVTESDIPDLVEEIVRLGGRVYSVESRHETLEDRFLQLLQDDGQG